MNEHGKSHRSVVPGRLSNEFADTSEERVEGRELAKGNPREDDAFRTQGRGDAKSGLERVRRAAERDRGQKLTALLHHVYDVERLRKACRAGNPKAAADVDGETWKHHGEELEGNLRDLSERLRRGAYRASPVKRALIPKSDGGQRPLGIRSWRTRSSREPSPRR